MSTKNKKAENYHSSLIEELLNEISPVEFEKTNSRMLIAAKIEDAIKLKGLTKKQFAAKLNKVPSEISKWLSGTHNFTHDTLFDICNVLGISMESLFKEEAECVQNSVKLHYNISAKGVETPYNITLYQNKINLPVSSHISLHEKQELTNNIDVLDLLAKFSNKSALSNQC